MVVDPPTSVGNGGLGCHRSRLTTDVGRRGSAPFTFCNSPHGGVCLHTVRIGMLEVAVRPAMAAVHHALP